MTRDQVRAQFVASPEFAQRLNPISMMYCPPGGI
jgi:hypothetical protein